MALPAVLLKAKGAIAKGSRVYNAAKQAKELDVKSVASSLVMNKFKLPIIAGLIGFVFILLIATIIFAYPRIIVEGLNPNYNLSGTGGNSSTNNNGSSDFTDEAPIETPSEGLPLPHYLQYDERWGSKNYPYSFGGGNTIAASACGPSSFAMVASYLTGKKLTPDQVLLDGKYHISGGTSWSYFEAAAKEFNCGTVKQSTSWIEVYAALKNGQPVIGSYNGASLFTSAGHFIVLRGVASDGKILVNDPNDNTTKKFINRHFTATEMQTGINMWFIFDKKL